MAERAHPNLKVFRDKFFGLIKSKWRENLFSRYLFCNDYIKNKVVLDIPCGIGWGSSLLKGYKELWGIDISPEIIEEAKQRYSNIRFKTGNMTSIDFSNNYFDVVICLEGFEHITFLEGQKFLSEIKRILKNDGLLILTTLLLNKNKYHSGNIYHLCEYKKEELSQVLNKKNFQIVNQDYLESPECKIIRIVLVNKKP
jgi:ubiquinone/menaquinone biosynthesis C-methylase UbiE